MTSNFLQPFKSSTDPPIDPPANPSSDASFNSSNECESSWSSENTDTPPTDDGGSDADEEDNGEDAAAANTTAINGGSRPLSGLWYGEHGMDRASWKARSRFVGLGRWRGVLRAWLRRRRVEVAWGTVLLEYLLRRIVGFCVAVLRIWATPGGDFFDAPALGGKRRREDDEGRGAQKRRRM